LLHGDGAVRKLLILLFVPVLVVGCAMRNTSPGSTNATESRGTAANPAHSSGGWDKPTMENWDYIPG
jgi:hypothetical protein